MLHGVAQLPQAAHGKQPCNGRTFVVVRATPDDHIMGGQVGCGIGRVDPSLIGGHHIQMGDDADSVLRIAHAQGGGVAIVVDHLKAVIPPPRHGMVEHLQAVCPEGHAGRAQIRPAHGGKNDPRLQLVDHLPPVFPEPFVRFLHQMGVFVHIRFHIPNHLLLL